MYSRRYQCTRGIWLDKSVNSDVLVMDVEGTDGIERGSDQAFERQSAEYIESVLPKAMKAKTTAAEAGYTAAWYKYADKVLGVDSFGLSAPGDEVFEAKGLTVPALVALAK